MTPRVLIASSQQDWVEESADLILQAADKATSSHGCFSLVLSGGNTPRPLYQALAEPNFAGGFDWPRTHIFWGDERAVPPDHPDSNYRMAKQALLDYIPIPRENVYRIKGELSPKDAAEDYENQIENYFGHMEKRFDLVLLGLGNDGHTASLFPETEALQETRLWAVSNYAPSQQSWRVTLTYPALLTAHQVVFLVSGAAKAEVVKQIIQNPRASNRYPAARVATDNPNLTWVLDQEAASLLNP